jgi:hypothetical protein
MVNVRLARAPESRSINIWLAAIQGETVEELRWPRRQARRGAYCHGSAADARPALSRFARASEGEGGVPVSQMMESLLDAGTKIDNLWSMYIVVHLGVFWFFFLMQRPLIIIERLIALIAYSFFAYINAMSLIASYRLLEALRVDLVNNFGASFTNAPTVYDAIGSVSYQDRGDLILITHFGAWIFVSLILIFRNSMIRYYEKHYPKYVITPSKLDLS